VGLRRFGVALFAFALSACAPLIDWDALTDGGGADASVPDASRDGTAPDAESDGQEDAQEDGPEDGPPANPCALVNCFMCNGYYCGRSNQNGFAGAAPNTLYECVDGSTVGTTTCETDCIMSTSTFPDFCDHCTGLPDGTYCGSALGYSGGYNGAFNQLDKVIFSCEGGVFSGSETTCGKSCTQNGNSASCQ
jgi:hypothetical protein